MIKNFKIFLEEVRLKDIANLKGFNQETKSEWGFDKQFDLNVNLVKFVTTNIRVQGRKIQLKISYYDDAIHNIRWKILKRTTLSDVTEFNKILKETIIKLLDKKTDFNHFSKYAVFLKEHNFSIVFKIDLDMKEFNLYTIIPGSGVNNVKEILVL